VQCLFGLRAGPVGDREVAKRCRTYRSHDAFSPSRPEERPTVVSCQMARSSSGRPQHVPSRSDDTAWECEGERKGGYR
jgi:hypothetical protein